MSSVYVRDQFKNYLEANSAETFIDLDGEFREMDEVLTEAGVPDAGPWVGLQYVGGTEEPITVGSTNDSGKYREAGVVTIYVCELAKLGSGASILTRANALVNLLRGKRLGDVYVESVTTPNFGRGATLDFEGGYISASVMVSYQRDLDL